MIGDGLRMFERSAVLKIGVISVARKVWQQVFCTRVPPFIQSVGLRRRLGLFSQVRFIIGAAVSAFRIRDAIAIDLLCEAIAREFR
jgi:hypothetical protein